jgi:hypothetical protein
VKSIKLEEKKESSDFLSFFFAEDKEKVEPLLDPAAALD